MKPVARAIYTPLIDMTPADPDTVTGDGGRHRNRLKNVVSQTLVIVTNGQLFYIVVIDVMWDLERFQFISR